MGHTGKRAVRRLGRVVACFLFCVGLSGFIWVEWIPLPVTLGRSRLAAQTTCYADCRGEWIAELPGPEARSHRPIALEAMGPWLPRFTIGREDQRFFRHPGLDLRAIAGAMVRGHGGASTLTQQVVKLATRRKKATYGTKLFEALVALQLEWRWGKSRILEEYLNNAPYGNRLCGVEAAALAYFGKPAGNLTRDEAAFLVGLPQAPSRLNPWRHPDAATQQFFRTLATLRTRGVLDLSEKLVPPAVERSLPANRAPHFINALLANTAPGNAAFLPRGGRFNCTLDLGLQREMEGFSKRHLAALNRRDIGEVAFVLIENASGAVRALGSVSKNRSDSNSINAALIPRSCGSTLKPFLYLCGIQQRLFTAATVLPDTADAVREVYPDYDPHNFARKHTGPVRVREALGSSLNVPAVVALGRVGARAVYEACTEWGMRFQRPLEHAGAGFILGNAGVTLLDLTSAYAGLARRGVALKPWFGGSQPIGGKRIAERPAVEIVADILCDNAARAGSFGWRSPLATGRRIAVKTGTSAGYRDAWTVGFTEQHTLGIWVGNLDGTPMSRTSSIVAAAPLWRVLVDAVLDQDTPLPDPDAQRVPVCALSGLLPAAASPHTVSEIFLPGTAPTEKADTWFDAGGAALLPSEYAGWCASPENSAGARVRNSPGELRILVPRDGAVYVLDHGLPAAQQQVEFYATQREGVVWTINGQPLCPDVRGRILWQLQRGEWTLEVTNGVTRGAHSIRVILQE
jgi:penicillin-binding protein 1C